MGIGDIVMEPQIYPNFITQKLCGQIYDFAHSNPAPYGFVIRSDNGQSGEWLVDQVAYCLVPLQRWMTGEFSVYLLQGREIGGMSTGWHQDRTVDGVSCIIQISQPQTASEAELFLRPIEDPKKIKTLCRGQGDLVVVDNRTHEHMRNELGEEAANRHTVLNIQFVPYSNKLIFPTFHSHTLPLTTSI